MSQIKFSGHTMGCPKWDIHEVIRRFGEIGYDGIEVRVAADGQIDAESITDSEARAIAREAKAAGMEFSCLTSYYKNFVRAEDRALTVKNLCRTAEIAAMLDCPNIRVYGGQEAHELPGIWFSDVWGRTAEGIREVASYAAGLGVGLVIETHVGSLTMSVRDTVRMIEDVNMHNVGMLFDYAWVELAGAEKGREAVRAAARHISHVHIKDWKLKCRRPADKTSCLMSEGSLDWPDVLDELKRVGYRGWVSDEYEYYWYPDDLPVPEIGMKHNLEYVKNYLI